MGVNSNVVGSQFSSATTSITINLSASLLVGFPTFLPVYTSSADPHVWPAGWTILFGAACDGGYFSVGKRNKVLGDPTTITVSNGGHSVNWRTAYAGFKSTNPSVSSVGIAASSGFVAPSSLNVAIPALADSPDEWLLLVVSSNAFAAFNVPAGPFTVLVGNDSTFPPILKWNQRSDVGSSGIALTRTGSAATTGVYAALLTDGGAPVASTGLLLDAEAARVQQHGYNGYAPNQEAYGGSCSVT